MAFGQQARQLLPALPRGVRGMLFAPRMNRETAARDVGGN